MKSAELAATLQGLGRRVTRRGDYYDTCCPVHDDHSPSLNFSDGDRAIVFLCRRGCPSAVVTTAMAALLGEPVAAFFFTARDNGHQPPSTIYTYLTIDGEVNRQVLKSPTGTFTQRRPDPADPTRWIPNVTGIPKIIYNLLVLQAAPLVCYVEGEKDADTLTALGLVATTHPNGAGAFRRDYAHQLAEAMGPGGTVAVLRDEDEPGRKMQAQVLVACHAEGLAVKQIVLPGLPDRKGADVSDWIAAGHTVSELRTLIDGTPLWSPTTEADEGAGAQRDDPDDARNDLEPNAPYDFSTPVPAGHFLADYIAYGAEQTDAAHEFHEGAGLLLLAAATPGVKVRLRQFRRGLGTNLYLLFIGPSTLSRRSTVADIARDLHDAVIPEGMLPDLTTPEGFLEQLARRPGQSSSWWIDEMTDLLDKLAHAKFMAGLRGALLSFYDGRDYQYRRHSKRTKAGAVEDVDWVRDPHLNLCGNATESLFETLKVQDLTSGFLPRFGILMPTRKPPRRPFEVAPPRLDAERARLTAQLSALWLWATSAPRAVEFAPGALAHLDAFAARGESPADGEPLDDRQRTMLRRSDPRLLKLALLVAAGRPETPNGDALMIQQADVEAAIVIATRWRTDAIAFARRLGESELTRLIERVREVLRTKATRGGTIERRLVAQLTHVEKKTLDRIEETLADWGDITVTSGGSGTGKSATWTVKRT